MSKPTEIVPEKILNFRTEKKKFNITNDAAIIYALGCGFSQEDHLNQRDLNFTYELSEDFKCLPTQFGTFCIEEITRLLGIHPHMPEYNLATLLHGEQWIEVISQVPIETDFYVDTVLEDFSDKGSGTAFLFVNNFYDDKDKIFLKSFCIMFIKDIKGHGYKSQGLLKTMSLPKVPEKNPDEIVSFKTGLNQALLYRIGGRDSNPLHVDTEMAKMGGFEKPILHGMCTYGIAFKAVYEKLCPDDMEQIVGFNARFTSHVFPGETIETMIWKKDDKGRTVFCARTKERKKIVLIGECKLKSPKF